MPFFRRAASTTPQLIIIATSRQEPGLKLIRKSRLKSLICAAILLSLVTGCVSIDETLSINSDGSGSYRIKYAMTPEAITRMSSALTLARRLQESSGNQRVNTDDIDSTPLLFDKQLIEKDIAKARRHSIILDELTVQHKQGRSHVDMTLSFTTLAGLTKTRFFSHRQLSLLRDTNQNYSVAIRTAGSGRPQGNTPTATGDDESLSTILAGFRAVTTINVPTRMLGSTARVSGMRSATWEFEYNRDRKALIRLQNTAMLITFSGEGLRIPELPPSPNTPDLVFP